jgi:hypothetical protein
MTASMSWRLLFNLTCGDISLKRERRHIVNRLYIILRDIGEEW